MHIRCDKLREFQSAGLCLRVALLVLCAVSLTMWQPALADGIQDDGALAMSAITATTDELAADYILGPGDTIQVEDVNMGALGLKALKVLADGTVDLPLIGEVNLAGRTLTQAQKEINSRYAEYYVNPQVSINVTTQHPIRIYVEGAVSNPGVYVSGKSIRTDNKTAQDFGLADTMSSYYRLYLSEALMMAGGLKQNADLHDVRIHRRFPEEKTIHVNLWEFLKNGDMARDLPLHELDVIEVSALSAEAVAQEPDRKLLTKSNLVATRYEVNVVGAVEKPGSYDLGVNDNLLTALTRAGGMSALADRKKVYILRTNSAGQVFKRTIDLSEPTSIEKAGKNGELAQLMPDDVIFVDESGRNKAARLAGKVFDRVTSSAMLPFFNQLVNF